MIIYLNVIARMTKIGEVIPLKLEWEDGRVFAIDKVLDVRKRASTKGGGMGLRYTVRILENQRYLYLADYKWFIEK